MHGSTRFSSSTTASTICASGRAGRVPGRGAEQVHDLAAALARPLDHRVDPLLRDELRQRDPPTVVAETTGTIWSPWPPSTSAVTSFTDAPVSQAMKVEKRAVSRIPAMPKTRSFGQPETGLATWHIASSGFETTMRIASGEARTTLLGDRADDPLVRGDEVVAAHARLARKAGGDHDHLGAGGLLVAVRAGDARLVAEHRACLVDVERLALRQALLDVDEDDVGVVALREHLRAGRTHVSGADDRDLASHSVPQIVAERAARAPGAGLYPRGRGTRSVDSSHT